MMSDLRFFDYQLLANVTIHRSVGLAGSVVLAFEIHTERVPCGGTEDIGRIHIVHADGNPQHRTHGDQIGADVTVGDRTVIGAPMIHHVICRLEGRFGRHTGSEPRAGPCVVRTLPKDIVHFFVQIEHKNGQRRHIFRSGKDIIPGHAMT